MKPSVLREMKDDELVESLEQEVESLKKLKMNHTVSQLENPMILRAKRRAIARINTEIKKRQLTK